MYVFPQRGLFKIPHSYSIDPISMVFNATFNTISVISWRRGGVDQSTRDVTLSYGQSQNTDLNSHS